MLPSLRDRTFRPALLKTALIATLVMLPFLGLTLLQNKAVTGAWTELPYQFSRSEYGVPTTFTLQPLPIPHRELTREQGLDYDIQSPRHGQGTDTLAKYWIGSPAESASIASFWFPRSTSPCSHLFDRPGFLFTRGAWNNRHLRPGH